MKDLSQPTPELAAFHKRWKKNRDFTSGKDAVLAGGEAYLPKPERKMGIEEYRSYIKEVSFYPACIKGLAGWKGLVFKEKPNFIGQSASFDQIKQVISPDGDTLEEFASAVFGETLITDWTGILVDHPERPVGTALNAANAIVSGYRPFLTMFPAETILQYSYAVVRNKRELVYTRLLESQTSVLELRLTDGVYTFERHTRPDANSNMWTSTGVKTPTRNGTPLTSIPFQIVTARGSKSPSPSPFEHMVDLNCDIWVQQGRYAQALRYCSNPVVVVTGIQVEYDDAGKAIEREYPYGPGVVWEFMGDAKAEFKEWDGAGATQILKAIQETKSELARTGIRILQDDKAAAEATETVMIRQTSENSVLAGIARQVSRQILKAIQIADWWLGNDNTDAIKFELNTDYYDQQITPAEILAALETLQSGEMSRKEFFKFLQRPGGLIDPVVTWDEHQSQLDETVIDRPIASEE